MTKLLPDGTPTGLCDCYDREIKVGDILQIPVECNEEMHGKWSLYRVVVQGITPLISYVRSEKGPLLPEGYMAAPLADEYDRKMFVFARDSLTLRPENRICAVDPESLRPLAWPAPRMVKCPECGLTLPLGEHEYDRDYGAIAAHSETHLPKKIGAWLEAGA